jgi:hypothetical protein
MIGNVVPRASILVVGLVLVVSACGGSAKSNVTTNSSVQVGALAFSRCMRSHGVPSFPDPNAQGEFPTFSTGVSKQTSVAANGVCKHLLRRGGGGGGGGTGTPEERQQKFTFALKVAQCLRTHGFPTFPDPGASGQSVPPGVKTDSPQFQAAESGCEKQSREALGLP